MGAEKPLYLSSGVLKRPGSGVRLDVGGRRLLGYSQDDYIYVGELMRYGGCGDADKTTTSSTYATWSGGWYSNLQTLYSPPTGYTRVYRLLGTGYASVVSATPVLSYKLYDYTATDYVDDTGGTDLIINISFSATNKIRSGWSNEFQQGDFPDFQGGSTRGYAIFFAQTGGVGAGTVNGLEASIHVFWKKS